jgi:hypothetical protein
VKNSVRSLKLGWLGTVYSGVGWLKLKDCFAFRARSSSFKLAISAFCFWISASCCIARAQEPLLGSSQFFSLFAQFGQLHLVRWVRFRERFSLSEEGREVRLFVHG